MEEIFDNVNISNGPLKRARVYRSGVAARMAGISVETLRVWERRYGLSHVERSERGQRLYSEDQVRHLSLLKQLVDQGHQIGVLALLPAEQLQEMMRAIPTVPRYATGPIRVAIIGKQLAYRIDAGGRIVFPLEVTGRCCILEECAKSLANAHAEVLLVEMSEIHEVDISLIAAARDAAGVTAVVVLYRFCSSAIIRQLREQGFLVARVPNELGEIVVLCRAALSGQRMQPQDQLDEAVPPRRFDDAALTRFASADNSVTCECPRHLADILLMLGSFESYTAKCISQSPDDAQLHRELEIAAGKARAMLEVAMDRLARADNLPQSDAA